MRKLTEYIVIHCSATPPQNDVDVKDIDRWHKERGFFGVGYHYVIKRDGTRQKGRNIQDAGAHVVGFNHKSVGVCLVGGMDRDNKVAENNFTKEQWVTLLLTLQELRESYPSAKIVGHRELNPGKDCPSFDVQGYLKGVTL
jgi:N-acetylmuramoyl-L-alanine amidase